MDEQNVALNITVNADLAATFVARDGGTEYADHPDRFTVVASVSGVAPTDPVFAGASLLFANGPAEALLLAAYEEASGFTTVYLMHAADGRAVLSTRPAN